jgi:UDPglucose 6-dehydrogenase
MVQRGKHLVHKDAISIFGLGYVGLTTAVCLASKDIRVIGVDVDSHRLAKINNGQLPFHEPGLEELLIEVLMTDAFSCTKDSLTAVRDSKVSFITVGTPSNKDGSIDLEFVRSASQGIGKGLQNDDNYHLIVVKSTVIPGTTEMIVKPAIENHSKKQVGRDFGLCVNPEYLTEGAALQCMFNPDRLVIGEYDKKSGDLLESLYDLFYGMQAPPILRTNLQNAELIKYANNAFLAMKISFINQMANLCQRVPNSDVEVIAKGIGLDKRIASSFLKAGLGWGGSCFPKDLKALLQFAKIKGVSSPLTEATLLVNEIQPLNVVKLVEKLLVNLKGARIALLGLSFKPKTDDMRNAVSIRLVEELLRRRVKITAYDPVAIENARSIFRDKVEYSKSASDCLSNADCAIVVTEWSEFAELKPNDYLSKMRTPLLIDARRIYDPQEFMDRLGYFAIGLGSRLPAPEPDKPAYKLHSRRRDETVSKDEITQFLT